MSMEDEDLAALKAKSDSYLLRFVSALMGGLIVWLPGWWAAEHGFKAAQYLSGAAFIVITIYGLSTWLRLAETRVKIRKARDFSA